MRKQQPHPICSVLAPCLRSQGTILNWVDNVTTTHNHWTYMHGVCWCVLVCVCVCAVVALALGPIVAWMLQSSVFSCKRWSTQMYAPIHHENLSSILRHDTLPTIGYVLHHIHSLCVPCLRGQGAKVSIPRELSLIKPTFFKCSSKEMQHVKDTYSGQWLPTKSHESN